MPGPVTLDARQIDVRYRAGNCLPHSVQMTDSSIRYAQAGQRPRRRRTNRRSANGPRMRSQSSAAWNNPLRAKPAQMGLSGSTGSRRPGGSARLVPIAHSYSTPVALRRPPGADCLDRRCAILMYPRRRLQCLAWPTGAGLFERLFLSMNSHWDIERFDLVAEPVALIAIDAVLCNGDATGHFPPDP